MHARQLQHKVTPSNVYHTLSFGVTRLTGVRPELNNPGRLQPRNPQKGHETANVNAAKVIQSREGTLVDSWRRRVSKGSSEWIRRIVFKFLGSAPRNSQGVELRTRTEVPDWKETGDNRSSEIAKIPVKVPPYFILCITIVSSPSVSIRLGGSAGLEAPYSYPLA